MLQTTISASSGGGINTFLIADIRGYTRYTLEHGDEAAADLTARFAVIAREEVETAGGQLLELRGDEVLAVFASARHALQGAVDLQYRLARESMANPALAFEVGVGLDAGEAVQVEGGYRGAALNLAARLCGVADAGEVLASEGVIHLAQKVPGLVYVPRGEMELKGFMDRIRVIQIVRDPELSRPDFMAVPPGTGSTPSFATLLRRYRRHAGLTQEELAEAANLSVRAVSDLERGERKHPRRDTIDLLADALQLSIDQRATLEASVTRRRGSQRDPSSDATITSGAHDPAMDTPLPLGGFLGALPEGVLVGRERELDRLQSILDTVASGTGQMIVLAGEPGVGKTRLAQEVMLGARNRKFVVATGRCYEPEQTVPFYPFIEAVATLYAMAPESVKAEVPMRWPQLVRLLPDAFLSPSSQASAGDEQQRLFWSFSEFLRAVAETSPVALLLDDLHWADASSVKLLQHLARHTRADRVLILGTFRDVELDRQHPLQGALIDLYREHLVTRLTIDPLDIKGTADLISTTIGPQSLGQTFVETAYRRTDGNPFFLREVLRELVEAGDVYRVGNQWMLRPAPDLAVPETVRAVIGQRLSRLKQETQEILYATSVWGQSFDFGDLEGIALPANGPATEENIEQALNEAVTAGIVRELGGERYSFNHALTQQALYMELPARRRRRLHLAAAESLDRLPERVRFRRTAELAWHFIEGGDPKRALPCEILAGDQAETIFAHPEAEHHYRTALELVRKLSPDELPSPGIEAQVLEKLGVVLKVVAQYDEALEKLEEAVGIYHRIGDLEGEIRVTAVIGFVYHLKGMPAEGMARIQPLIDTSGDSSVGTGQTMDVYHLYIPAGYLFIMQANYREALRAAEHAAGAAKAAGDDRTLGEAEAMRGLVLLYLGRVDQALHVLRAAIPLAEASENQEVLFLALDVQAEAYMHSGQFLQCRANRMRAVELAQRERDPAKTAFELTELAYVNFCLGQWDDAHTCLEQALSLLEPLEPSWGMAHVLIRSGMYSLASGDWDRAKRLLVRGVDMAQQARNPEILAAGLALTAELAILQGLPQAALSSLSPLVDESRIGELQIASLQTILAWALLAIGQITEAAQAIAGVVDRAREHRNLLTLVDALRVQGMVLSRHGRSAEAQGAFEEGLSLAGSLPYPYARARILREHGSMLSAIGNVNAAREGLSEALSEFVRLGAKFDVDDTSAELKRL